MGSIWPTSCHRMYASKDVITLWFSEMTQTSGCIKEHLKETTNATHTIKRIVMMLRWWLMHTWGKEVTSWIFVMLVKTAKSRWIKYSLVLEVSTKKWFVLLLVKVLHFLI